MSNGLTITTCNPYCQWPEKHHHVLIEGMGHTHGGPATTCLTCADFRNAYEGGMDPAQWHAEQLFSSLEAWERTPEDHRAETPKRFVKALKQLTEREEFNFTTFPAKKQDMITLSPIPFYTLCAHHIVPFHGQAYVSYVPDKHLAGLSKFARAVKYQAKGFWVQEELTDAIADFLEEKLNPLGVAVVLKAEHMCMAMRGVEVAGVMTTTSTMRGVYADHSRTAKAEFMAIVNG